MSIALLLSLAAPSLAALPVEGVPVRPAVRAYTVSAATQDRLRRAPGWVSFAAGEGAGWAARFDERTGTARRAWGPGIAVGPVRTEAEAIDAIMDLLGRNAGILGVPRADLRGARARFHARTDTWYVAFERRVGDVPIVGAGVTARIRGGRVVMLGVDTHPDAPVQPRVRVSVEPARAAAVAGGGAPGVAHRFDGARLVVLPVDEGYALVWEIRTRTTSPPGRWVAHVDAHTGVVRGVRNDVRFLDGTLTGTHDARWPNGETLSSALAGVTLTGSAGTVVYTDDAGAFSLPDGETFTAALTGPTLRVTNEAGAEGSLAIADGAPHFSTADATAAEIDAWVFLQQARAFGLRFAPDLALWSAQLRAKVNVSIPCSAFYDGALEFGVEGSGCNNLGRIADVAYHEWGHALHDASVLVGVVDPTLGEGLSDYVAALQTLDSTIALGFYDDGGMLREIATDRVYPDDLTGNIYDDGRIFSGAAWDLLGALQARYGEGADVKGTAWAVASQLLVDALPGGPELDTVYDEYVLADDDDGDLANGTPHLCEIVAAFGAHGLGPLGDAFPATLAHTPLANQPADTAIPVVATVRSLAPGCLDATVSGVEVRWSADGGAWQAAPLAEADGAWSGALPAFPDGTVVAYRVVALGPAGEEVALPAGEPHTFYVGALTELLCADFAADDGGFTHAALDGVGPTADDWAFGAPAGAGDDPGAAYTPGSVWGNDLGATDGAYPPNVRNRLTAPTVGTGGAPLVVQFRRWLAVGAGDHARVLVNDSEHWATTGTVDTEWVLHTLVVEGRREDITLAWELESGEAAGFGGWNLDDVCFYAAGAPPDDTGDTADSGDTADTGDTAPAVDTAPADDTGEPPPPDETCTCASGSAGALPALLGALVVSARRRRSSVARR